jgi:hypothetical protein
MDPRVGNETFPFDRPQLWSEQTATRPTSVGGSLAVPGAGVPTTSSSTSTGSSAGAEEVVSDE